MGLEQRQTGVIILFRLFLETKHISSPRNRKQLGQTEDLMWHSLCFQVRTAMKVQQSTKTVIMPINSSLVEIASWQIQFCDDKSLPCFSSQKQSILKAIQCSLTRRWWDEQNVMLTLYCIGNNTVQTLNILFKSYISNTHSYNLSYSIKFRYVPVFFHLSYLVFPTIPCQ